MGFFCCESVQVRFLPTKTEPNLLFEYICLDMSEQQRQNVQKFIKEEQAKRMLNAVYEQGHDRNPLGMKLRNKAIISLLYDTGLRIKELTQLTPSMLRLEDQELFIPSHIQKQPPNKKQAKAVYITLGESELNVLDILRNYTNSEWYNRHEDGYLFPTRQSPRMKPKSVNKMLRNTAETGNIEPYCTDGTRAEPQGLTSHVFRHSVGNWMLKDENRRLIDVRNRLRHSSINTTERIYEHFRRV